MLRSSLPTKIRALSTSSSFFNVSGLAGDPERLRQMIDRKKALLKKSSAAPPKKLPITDYYIPHSYKTKAPRTREQMVEHHFDKNEQTVLLKNWSHYQLRL